MKKTLISLFSFFSFLLMPLAVYSTPIEEKLIIEVMQNLGFENISVNRERNNYRLSYENRTFLHEMDAIGVLMAKLKSIVSDNAFLQIAIQSNGNQIITLDFSLRDYQDFISGKIDSDQFYQTFTIDDRLEDLNEEKTNPLFLHSDLVLSPAYTIGMVDGPTIYFSPYLNTYLDKGFSFTSKYRLPVYNIVNGFDFGKNTQQYPPVFTNSYLDYTARIGSLPLYTMFRTGYWNNGANNLILSNSTQYQLFGGLLSLNLNTGLDYNLNNGKTDFSILPYSQLYLGSLDLIIEGGGGKLLNNEYSLWGRITRQFVNTDIGFSLYRTFRQSNSSWTMNFEFMLALGPEQSIKAAPVRITYPRFYRGFLLAGTASGIPVPGDFFLQDNFLKRLYPEYIRTHLEIWKKYL